MRKQDKFHRYLYTRTATLNLIILVELQSCNCYDKICLHKSTVHHTRFAHKRHGEHLTGQVLIERWIFSSSFLAIYVTETLNKWQQKLTENSYHEKYTPKIKTKTASLTSLLHSNKFSFYHQVKKRTQKTDKHYCFIIGRNLATTKLQYQDYLGADFPASCGGASYM